MENVLPASLRHLSHERSVAGGKEYMSGWAYERDYHPTTSLMALKIVKKSTDLWRPEESTVD